MGQLMARNGSRSRIPYGPAPQQFGDLTVPGRPGPHPILVFIHGGFWRNRWDLSLSEPMAENAVSRGFATWNIEYRRTGDPGGGYPGTLYDVAAAVDHLAVLASRAELDIQRLAVIGHSAGGHLAMWIGQREKLPADAPGGAPKIVPRLVVGQAPVADLEWARQAGLGAGAVDDLMGKSPDADARRWELADPALWLPPACEQLIVHGTADTDVPIAATISYQQRVIAAASGSESPDRNGLTVEMCDGSDHFDIIDPSHVAWQTAIEGVSQVLG